MFEHVTRGIVSYWLTLVLIGTEKLIIGKSAVIKVVGSALTPPPHSVGRRSSPVLPRPLSSRRGQVRGGERWSQVPVLQHCRELQLQVHGGAAVGDGGRRWGPGQGPRGIGAGMVLDAMSEEGLVGFSFPGSYHTCF